MRFSQAMAALEEGKKVRGKNWIPNSYFQIGKKERPGSDGYIFMQFLEVEDWELYQEPEKTYSFMEMLEKISNNQSLRFTRKKWLYPTSAEKTVCHYGDFLHWHDKYGMECIFRCEDYQATDWIEA